MHYRGLFSIRVLAGVWVEPGGGVVFHAVFKGHCSLLLSNIMHVPQASYITNIQPEPPILSGVSVGA